MGSKFKPGDKVKYVGEPNRLWGTKTPDPASVYTVSRAVNNPFSGVYLFEHTPELWYDDSEFVLVEPDPRAVPGIPEGYRLVRIGRPAAGEEYLDSYNKPRVAPHSFITDGYPVVEKTTKTERLWVWVDKETGEATDQWFADGAVPTSGTRISEVRTNKTREVPA